MEAIIEKNRRRSKNNVQLPMAAAIDTASTMETNSETETEGLQTDDAKVLPAEATEAVTDSDLVTAAGNLKIRSKKTERMKRKMAKKTAKMGTSTHLLDMPNEVLIKIITNLLPSDIFRLLRTCSDMQFLVEHNRAAIGKEIIAMRYPILEKCFMLPVPLNQVDKDLHERLQDPKRLEALTIHRKYQHIPIVDPKAICTCLSCVVRWNSICIAVDFSHWQESLENGIPIRLIQRGLDPGWNVALNQKTRSIVSKALVSPLHYAHILEVHLRNTAAAIKRHSSNKGNKRRHFLMTQADVQSQTDEFLGREGPSTTDLPFHRDNYYMLEVFMPGRTWLKEEKKWAYVPANLHKKDLGFIQTKWAADGVYPMSK
ncbi:F-box domain-containing protein [Colletotrichum plurivorum]|uniref:F-box domain-containing protein n=1 Tax=Colletotrichum plurivorum TaxID=2175906 RepID=A0A8H6KF22_9PEZI|nr:F-box domain-containing protein [Colletotrichum plurivorum]